MGSQTKTRPVAFEVIGVELIRGEGPLIALAVVKLELSGMAFTLERVQVLRTPEGGMEVRSPVFRHPTA